MTEPTKPLRALNAQTYLDVKLMADLIKVFVDEGIAHKSSYSHVLYSILHTTWKQWDCAFFTTTEEALEFLSINGFSLKQLKSRNHGKKFLKAMNREALSEEEKEPSLFEQERSQAIATLLEEEKA